MSAVRALFSFLRNGIIFRFRLITFGNIHFYIFPFFRNLNVYGLGGVQTDFVFFKRLCLQSLRARKASTFEFRPCFFPRSGFSRSCGIHLCTPASFGSSSVGVDQVLSHHLPLAPALGFFFLWCGSDIRPFKPFTSTSAFHRILLVLCSPRWGFFMMDVPFALAAGDR